MGSPLFPMTVHLQRAGIPHRLRAQLGAVEGSLVDALQLAAILEAERREVLTAGEGVPSNMHDALRNDDAPDTAVVETAVLDALEARLRLEDDLAKLFAALEGVAPDLAERAWGAEGLEPRFRERAFSDNLNPVRDDALQGLAILKCFVLYAPDAVWELDLFDSAFLETFVGYCLQTIAKQHAPELRTPRKYATFKIFETACRSEVHVLEPRTIAECHRVNVADARWKRHLLYFGAPKALIPQHLQALVESNRNWTRTKERAKTDALYGQLERVRESRFFVDDLSHVSVQHGLRDYGARNAVPQLDSVPRAH